MTYPIRVRACALIIEDEKILLVEFEDHRGVHYNLPAGGVEQNESVVEAVKREAKEEASIDVEVGQLALVYEYAPHLNDNNYGETPSLHMIFECKIQNGTVPKLPKTPDPHQIGVKWIPLNELDEILLFPKIEDQILAYVQRHKMEFVEEHLLAVRN
ncbi:NUDIX domain-containing protein [Ureibacillus chungkukjangi]|uniref:ADP-ribose pyrophosphatase YjhB (NUDIX family) n=1 Tax=Ureibacillus chungkukjangi TaxID=1202712 RepID=A0A318TU90_9BACL|nr:NUDIX domain-containing protein [Ureibacillus chungkukjangi]PYF08362.1 ADP-ribose pyrophosphatase YjhB (NUDIX family) [Ureibacillus chungkukjangi]